jgi:hypothetical protein
MAMIVASDNTPICTQWSQHAGHNAFQAVVLADHVRGIFWGHSRQNFARLLQGLD